MINNLKTYRKYRIFESVLEDDLETYLQERGIEILKIEETFNTQKPTYWIKSKADKIYKLEKISEQKYILSYWDWLIKEGGLNPINKHTDFVAVPHYIEMSIDKCIFHIRSLDKQDGVIVMYQINKIKNPTFQYDHIRKDIFMETEYLENIEKFLENLLKKIGSFYRTWYFQDGKRYSIKIDDSGTYNIKRLVI